MSRRVVCVRKWSVLLMALCVLVAGLGFTEGTEAQEARRHHGVAIAVVVDVVDPQAAGRIKVKFPWLPDSPEIASRSRSAGTSMGSGRFRKSATR